LRNQYACSKFVFVDLMGGELQIVEFAVLQQKDERSAVIL